MHHQIAGTFGNQYPARQHDAQRTAFYFYLVFVYIHQCPQGNWTQNFKSKNGRWTACKRSISQHVFPLADALAIIIEEVDYTWRLDPYNHYMPPFDKYVTGIVDVFPVPVPCGQNFGMASLFYQPKYEMTCLKYQVGISLLGDIILFTGPNLGVASDANIWENSWADHPFFGWERWLADLGYEGCTGLIYKFKHPPILPHQVFYNNLQEWVRNRVENVIGVIKKHRIFLKGIYQGTYEHLVPLIHIVGHVTAYELRLYSPRFHVYGPWRHT